MSGVCTQPLAQARADFRAGRASWDVFRLRARRAHLWRDTREDWLAGAVPGGQVYVAQPVTEHVAKGRIYRVIEDGVRITGALLAAGASPVSPALTSSIALSLFGHRDDLAVMDHADWMSRAWPILAASRALVIPDLDGWDRSLGVWLEAHGALGLSMPIVFVEMRP